MLDLEFSDQNEMKINDSVLGSIVLIYKDPPPKDFLKLKSIITNKILSKVPIEDVLEFQILQAMQYLTGVKEGYLAFAGKPISTNPKDKNYKEDWKELLYKKGYKFLQKYSEALFGDYSTSIVKKDLDFFIELREYEDQWTEEKEKKLKDKFGIKDGVVPSEIQQKSYEFTLNKILDEKKEYRPDVRFNHTTLLVKFQNAGLQFEINDLSTIEWLWISEFKSALQKFHEEKLKEKTTKPKNGKK